MAATDVFGRRREERSRPRSSRQRDSDPSFVMEASAERHAAARRARGRSDPGTVPCAASRSYKCGVSLPSRVAASRAGRCGRASPRITNERVGIDAPRPIAARSLSRRPAKHRAASRCASRAHRRSCWAQYELAESILTAPAPSRGCPQWNNELRISNNFGTSPPETCHSPLIARERRPRGSDQPCNLSRSADPMPAMVEP